LRHPKGLAGWQESGHPLSEFAEYHAGKISFGELKASIQGWVNHVGHANSWGLREHVLDTLVLRPADHQRASAARHHRS